MPAFIRIIGAAALAAGLLIGGYVQFTATGRPVAASGVAVQSMAAAAGAEATGCTAPQQPGAAAFHATLPAASRLSLVLNIPAFRLDVFEAEQRLASYPVAVGSPRYRTPRGEFRITEIAWNPWWHPPPSEWARDKKVTPPGPRNPMGRVKLKFEGLYFIHGTPEPESMGRAASHGCVRMTNAQVIELTRLIHHHANLELSEAEIERLVSNASMTRTIALREPVPLTIGYHTVELRDGALELHPDVYRLSTVPSLARVERVLREAGYEGVVLRRSVLEPLLERSQREHVAVPLEEIVEPRSTRHE